MTEYTLGFAWDSDLKSVLLIQKLRPPSQAGLLNGVGGKIEPDDAGSYAGMVREFSEETGFLTAGDDWIGFGRIGGRGPNPWIVHLFAARIPDLQSLYTDVMKGPESERWPTDETPVLIPWTGTGLSYCMPNLDVLVPASRAVMMPWGDRPETLTLVI